MNSKLFLTFLIALFVSGSVAGQELPPKPCDSREEYRQFDFWIGEWEVTNPNEQFVGSSRIELMLDGCVLQENWTSANPNYSGKSFNYFNSVTGKWQQKWVDNQGVPIEFEGTYDSENKSMNLEGKGFNQADSTLIDYKLTFYHINDDYVRQVWEQSSDGENWTTIFDGHYRRKTEN